VAFSPDGRLLASSSDIDFTIKLWNTATGALQQTLEGHSDRVQSVAFSPDGRLLASGSDDETIRLWDTSIRALKQNFKGHSGAVRLVAFSPDGRLLASSSDIDLTIKLWDTATGALQQTLSIGGVVTNLKFSEDCPYLSTNLGFLNIKPWYNNHLSYLSKNNVEVFIREDQWVTLQGKRLLWLPTEYRPTTSAVKMDGTLILGHASGRISFIRVRA
jgi:WD40 repeat protein